MRVYVFNLLMLASLLLLSACEFSFSTSDEDVAASLTNKNAKTERQYYDASVALARANGCWACHHVESGSVGPAWRIVSERYKNDPGAREWLLRKVKEGGKGNWTVLTSGAVMPPNSPRVSDDHILQLVDFILSLERESDI